MDISLPDDALSLFDPLTPSGTILVVTGGRGVGKTTLCQQAIEQYRKAGLKVSGILSPGRFENHRKNGIFAEDLESHETRLTASSVPGEIDGIRFGYWNFDSSVFEWGNQRLLNLTETDILVIDEIGFFEFDLNTGWKACFDALNSKKYRMALVVIRPECIDNFSSMGYEFKIKEVSNLLPQPNLKM